MLDGRERIQGRAHDSTTEDFNVLRTVSDNGAMGVGVVADDEKSPCRKRLGDPRNELYGKLCELMMLKPHLRVHLLAAIQPLQHRKGEDLVPARKLADHREHDPLVTEMKEGAALRREPRVSMHTRGRDVFTSVPAQGVVDGQLDDLVFRKSLERASQQRDTDCVGLLRTLTKKRW